MKRLLFSLAMFSTSFFFSCKKETSAPTITLSPLGTLISADTSLSIFNYALTYANDTALLNRQDSNSVIMPVNSAFLSAGLTANAISAMPVSSVDSMLKYYFISGTITPSNSVLSSYSSALGLPIFGNNDNNRIYFNGYNATPVSGNAGTYTTYKTSSLLMPPVASINQYLANDTSLSLFNEAIKKTGAIISLITTNGWYTILAPTNQAFINAGYTTLSAIDNASLPALTQIINYHILNGPFFSNHLINSGGTANTDEGESLTITNNAGIIQITGQNNTNPASVVTSNVLLSGYFIVHKIDTVLMP